MSIAAVLLPVFVQVTLIFVLMVRMGRARVAAVRRGEAKLGSIALGEPNWPADVMKTANAFNNQFQLPVLFMLLVAFAWATRKADLLFVLMSWAFVLSRVAHAFIHVTSNVVLTRFRLYVAGGLVLMAMWAIFAARIFTGL
ncbi:MAG: MAPEG family protein [Alsobacter sp.]